MLVEYLECYIKKHLCNTKEKSIGTERAETENPQQNSRPKSI